MTFLDDFTPIGALPSEQAGAALRDIGETEVAEELEEAATADPAVFGLLDTIKLRRDRIWRHTSHTFGYLAPGDTTLIDARTVTGDATLAEDTIKMTLDYLRIADYPGGGVHTILFDFFASNQTAAVAEPVHVNALYRVSEGDAAAVVGRPIFTDLSVGPEGVLLQFVTVNVKNEDDERLLAFLDGDVFKAGVRLLNTAQPALVPFSAMAVSLTKAVAARNRNVTVQSVDVGLDFSTISTRARLAEGSYVIVQVPGPLLAVWRWDDWIFDAPSGRIAHRSDGSMIPYNYVVLGVSRS
jgi:hypothetical protein